MVARVAKVVVVVLLLLLLYFSTTHSSTTYCIVNPTDAARGRGILLWEGY